MSLMFPQSVENMPVAMVCGHLDDIPQYELPPPYTIRSYQPGDAEAWTRMHLLADVYNTNF